MSDRSVHRPPVPPPALEVPSRSRLTAVWSRLDLWFMERSPRHATVLGFFGTVVLAMADILSGGSFQFSGLYLIPIGIAAWWGTVVGAFVSLGVAAALATGADWLAGPPHGDPAAMVWNLAVRLVGFSIFVQVMLRLRDAHHMQRHLAFADPLTGLANSRAFVRHLRSEINRCRRYGRVFTLAYLDLDHFKSVNDTLGHAEGDRLLRELAGVLRGAIRITDFSARLGGDEFALLFPETPHERARAALDKVRNQVDELMALERWPVTTSVGAVTFEVPPASADEAIQVVDQLMYRVKRQGRDGIRHLRWSGNGSPASLLTGPDENGSIP